MIIVHAHLPIQPDKREEFIAAAAGLVAASNAEPGIVSYTLYESVATPNEFIIVEKYADDAAWDAHLQTPHFQGAVGALGGWLAGAPRIVKHQSDEGEDVQL